MNKSELTLVLMRHGEAEAHLPTASDRARHLTQRGQKETSNVGEKLSRLFAKQILKSFVTAVSDATRTRETFNQVALSCPNLTPHYFAAIYTANHTSDLLSILRSQIQGSPSILMLIGHNPTISQCASDLTGDFQSFAPGDCMILQIQSESWDIALESENAWTVKHVILAANP